LQNAPHPQDVVMSSEWKYPYSREVAAYPAVSFEDGNDDNDDDDDDDNDDDDHDDNDDNDDDNAVKFICLDE